MKFCHNRSKKKNSQGLPLADIRRCEKVWNKSKGHILAWSLSLFSLLALAPTAQAQVSTSLDWGTGVGGDAVDFPVGTTQNTYTNVGGSGVDVRVTVAGDVGNNGNANLTLSDSDFVSPSPPDETLLVNLLGQAGNEATVTIEFLLTGTATPVDVTLASFPIHDLDILFNNGTVSWQDEVVVSASSSSGGTQPPTPVGITAGGEAAPEGTFNQEVVTGTSVTVTGVAPGDNPAAPTQNANSPRIPGLTNATTVGNYEEGNVNVNVPTAVDTISLLFRNGPGSADFAPHAISIGDIAFTAPVIEEPAIGVSKRVVSTTTQADGDFEVVYETTVENLGNVTLNNVQLTEDLDDTYGEGAFTIIGAPTFTARGLANEVTLTPNAAFDADAPNGTPGDTNILAAAQTLQVGENSTFQFTVEVESTLVTTPGTFTNQIDAAGISPNNTTVNDASDDGVETDADPNDGNPGGGPTENDPTPVVLPPTPVIGVAKQVVSTVLEPSGSFGANTARVTYNIVVANIGTVPLEQVQLDENFNPVYGAGTFQVVSVTFADGATTVAADAGFDGIDGSNTTLLLADAAGTPTGTLAVGATSTFQLIVDVDSSNPNLTPALPGPYDNQVTATATDAAGNPTSDLSDSGTDVDPDGDGDPNEDNGSPADPDNPVNDGNENTPTRVRFSPDVRLVKRITRVTRNGTEVTIPNIGVFNDQTGDSNDNTLSTLSGNSLPVGLSDVSESLQSGDIVEYTIYFFNAGLGAAENLELCDELQSPSVLQPASLELAQPTALSTGGTTLNFSNIGPLSPRAPLSPLEPSCISAPGTFRSGVAAGGLGVGAGGGVVVGGPTSGLNIDTSEVGAFRFEIQFP